MSVHAPQRGSASYEADVEDERGYGWVSFAGILLFMLGILNVVEGIAAIGNARFFVHDTSYVFGSLRTWGWVTLCIGAIQLAVGAGVFVKNPLARWAGVGILGLNAIAQLLMIPAYPFWSLAIFAIDILAIYGLVVYGQRIGAD